MKGGGIVTAEIVWEFAKSFCVLFFVTFVFSRLNIVKKHLTVKPAHIKEKCILALLFGALGCVGSGIGVEFHGSLVNTRVIGVAAGGLIGGPLVGIFSGLIAGAHRVLFVNAGMATAAICGVSMLAEGAFAGFLSRYSPRFAKLWPLATLTVVACELFRKLMLLVFIRPFDLALLLVKNMTFPMIVINSLGVALFITFIENVAREQEQMKARQAEIALALMEELSTSFRRGLIGEHLRTVVKTIGESSDFTHILIANASTPIISNLSPEAQSSLSFSVRELKKRAAAAGSCFDFTDGDLRFIAAPLADDAQIAGFLLLGKPQPLSAYDWKLAGGLGKLFSAQLTRGNLEYRSSLVKDAEIKILQTQVNPHFLFNTLTVINSLCRTDPGKARGVIDHLAEFYRRNLRINARFVSLQDEIGHIEAYLEIIKARYASKIDIRYDVDQQLDCCLPPLSLQPLVENSIKHGLLPKKEGGVISIRAKREEERNAVRIEVEDNGKGFDLNRVGPNDSNYIGLNNVRKRLLSSFGDDLGWEIDTKPDAGTRVTIVIPALRNA